MAKSVADGSNAPGHTERQPLLSAAASVDSTLNDDYLQAAILPVPEKIALRVSAAMFSFFIMGVHTAAIAVLIPYMEPFYNISDTMISLLFVTPVAGYLLASLTNSTIHAKLGRRGIAIIGTTCQLLITVVAACHPPYAIFLLAFAVAGFGIGLIDAGWCAWAAGLSNANTISGFLHGSYSAGATVGPYLTASLIAGAKLPWYSFYWAMTIPATVGLFTLTWAFRHDTGPLYQSEKAQAQAHDAVPLIEGTKPIWKHKVIYICAAYLVAYVGAETVVAGWIVTFMLRIRAATPFTASMCASGFWGGMALGRMTLGSVTDRFGERASVTLYLLFALAAEAVFCFVTPIAVAVVSMCMLGFWLGPIFPTGIVMITRLMPRELHVDAVASVNVVGQLGGALFPFVVGATAERLGIQSLQPFVFALLVCVLGFWWCFPRLPVRKEMHDDRPVEGLEDGMNEETDHR